MQPDIPAEPSAGDPSGRDTMPPPAPTASPAAGWFPPAADSRPPPGGLPPYPASHPEPFISPAPQARDHGQRTSGLPSYPAGPPPYVQSGAYPYQQPTYGQPTQYQPTQYQPDQCQPPQYQPPQYQPPQRHRIRFLLTVVAALLGVAGLIASAAGLATQIMPRRFSAAQQRQIMAWETAGRWRT